MTQRCSFFFINIFIYCITIKGIYVRMNSLLKRSFAGNSPRFSFLTVSLYGTQNKKSGVRQGAIFLQSSLWYNENNKYYLHVSFAQFLKITFSNGKHNVFTNRVNSAYIHNCHFSNFLDLTQSTARKA